MRCLGPFFHDWEKWQDGKWKMTRLLTMADGVPCEMWGKPYEFHVEVQARACKDCGRRQVRKIR